MQITEFPLLIGEIVFCQNGGVFRLNWGYGINGSAHLMQFPEFTQADAFFLFEIA